MNLLLHRVFVGLLAVLLILVSHLVLLTDVAAQGPGRKSGFGGLFNSRSSQSSQQGKQQDRKVQSLQAVVMMALPADRHYREVLAEAIVMAYQKRGFRNLWNHRQMPSRLKDNLSQHLSRHGIPEEMALSPGAFAMIAKKAPVNARDLGYTIAIADSGALVRFGAIPPVEIWPEWNKGDRPGDHHAEAEALADNLLRATSYPSFRTGVAVDTMASRNWIYRELQNGYISSRKALANSHRFPRVPDPASFGLAKPGKPYDYASELAENLALRGHLKLTLGEIRALRSVTPALTEGIKSFQRSNGLSADGVMGSGTWKYLSMDPATILKKRAINLNRARLLPDNFGKKYLIINIPSAELFAFDEGVLDYKMRIVYGKDESEDFHTPVFRDVMNEVVFAPYWNVPESISMKEIYPKLIEDLTYLDTRQYEIVNNFNDNATVFELNEETLPQIESGKLWLRQKPTPGNALGKVKFLLPNQFHIYLHDTPSRHLFAQENRAQSHGCIRLADPPKMAQWTLKNQGWEPNQIKEAMNATAQIRQKLDEPVNVYITYFTSFPRPTDSSEGRFVLAFEKDVYQLDDKHAETLSAVLP